MQLMEQKTIPNSGLVVPQGRKVPLWPAILWCAVLLLFWGSIARGAEIRQIQDDDITAAIEEELIADPAVSAHLIDVETKHGVATLSGSVDTLLAGDRAVELAERIKGVRAIINRISVRPIMQSDEKTREHVKKALLSDPATDSYEVDVKVKGGLVTLSGTVESWAEEQLIEEVVKGVKGVHEIQNNLEIEYEGDRSDAELKAHIKKCLDLDPYVNACSIDVNVEQGEVALSGAVTSLAEKSSARTDAWLPAVIDVNATELNVKWWLDEEMERDSKIVAKSDLEITEAVEFALSIDPRLDTNDIQVRVINGTATLSGTVDNLRAKHVARQDAKNIRGVWKVENKLKVRPVNPPSDTYIEKAVRNAMNRDAIVEKYTITVLVRNQKVYLYGTVNNHYEKQRAEHVAAGIFGVAAIQNSIQVAATSTAKSDGQIKEDVRDQLFWSPYVDEDDVSVAVEDGTVTLAGAVDSWHELKAAVENAFQAGAKSVRTHTKIRERPDIDYPEYHYRYFFWGS